MKKIAIKPLKHPNDTFSPKSLLNRFTSGYTLSREVTWSIKNHTVTMVIDPWPDSKVEGCGRGLRWRGIKWEWMVCYGMEWDGMR